MIVVLLAFGLTLFRLAQQDIWGDEAASIGRSHLSWLELLTTTTETHPPLYSAVMAVWFNLGGESPFAIRFLDVCAGVLAVALTFALGRILAWPLAGLLGSLLFAVSPLAVYYSQEARMYMPAVTLTLGSSVLAAKMFGLSGDPRAGNGRRLFAWTLLGLAGLFTHYFTAFVYLVHNLAYLSTSAARRSWRPPLATWITANALLLAAAAAWFWLQGSFLSGQTRSGTSIDVSRGLTNELDLLRAFAVGTLPGQTIPSPGIVLFGLAALGVLALLASNRGRAGASGFLIALFLVPAALTGVASIFLPVWSPRYGLNALPVFLLLAGVGIALPARLSAGRAAPLRIVSAIAVGILAVAAIVPYQVALERYFDPGKYSKGGYGKLMDRVRRDAAPGDALLLLNPLQETLYDYYAPAEMPAYWFPLPESLTTPASQQELDRIARAHPRLWLVAFGDPAESDPGRELERWLAGHTFRVSVQDFADSRLSLHLTGDRALGEERPANVTLGQTAQLTGYRLNVTELRPGDTLFLSLRWRVPARSDRSYTVFTHLLGETVNPTTGNRIWGQVDAQPANGTRPTSTWRPGETIDDRYSLELDGNAPAGRYELEVGMYDAATGARLVAADGDGKPLGDRIVLTAIEVRR